MSNKHIKNSKSNKTTRKSRNKKRLPLWSKIIIALVLIIILLFTIVFSLFHTTLNKMNNIEINKENLGVTSKEELQVYDNYKKIKNIALFGVDSENGVGRSDAIMIATVDPVHNKLKVTSIMRDSYVNIEGYEYDKINHAYAFGGPELSIKTLNQTFGLNIEDFVAVDFASLPVIIDILGGVEIDITEEEVELVPYVTYAGPQILDGEQTLAYSRIRYASGGDYQRTQRQRNVLSALFSKALSLPVSEYPSFINNMLPLIQTNLEATDILSLATKVAGMSNGVLEQERFPLDGYSWGENIDGVYYLAFDEIATKKQMMDYIFDDK
ncbi:LCP family protein [Clostridium disporicum]|uniref:Cell envelope-related function transcriptional attenuator n=1 Tax=Clostridium disporicum TaxID=84024 RepID=A0A174F2I1_9CLOT|nr:LCP family protein [Clostridium disporicum]CUO43138.1 cell envelope-related function transcriptional attenuator [Clostridium disporicum]